MKKLTKKNLVELAEVLPVIDSNLQRKFVGGGDATLRIEGGYLVDTAEGVVFKSDSGCEMFFEGVDISTSSVAEYSAYQFNGTIHISQSWADSGFGISVFVHEYGHYLQQNEMGTFKYITDVAIPSVYSAATDPENHSSQSYEQDATERGEVYWNNH